MNRRTDNTGCKLQWLDDARAELEASSEIHPAFYLENYLQD